MNRVRYWCCVLSALVAGGSACYLVLAKRAPAALSPVETTYDLGTVESGDHQFAVRFRNTGDTPGRLIGFDGTCDRNYCFKHLDSADRIVPPHGDADCVGVVSIRDLGRFEGPITVFYFDTDIRQVVITVKGNCVPRAGGAPKQP